MGGPGTPPGYVFLSREFLSWPAGGACYIFELVPYSPSSFSSFQFFSLREFCLAVVLSPCTVFTCFGAQPQPSLNQDRRSIHRHAATGSDRFHSWTGGVWTIDNFPPIQTNMAARRLRMAAPSLALILPALLFADGAFAHDHHGESNIPEGQTISLEPIVRNFDGES